jgi:hypothetical protein
MTVESGPPGQPPLRRSQSAPNLARRAAGRGVPADTMRFRVAFSSLSMGTEQELSGVTIRRPKDAGRKIGEVVKNGDALVLITTDMVRSQDDAYHFCTLEIVTTPTEDGDAVGWAHRGEAFSLVIAEIEQAARKDGGKGGALRSCSLGAGLDYFMLICTTDHTISMDNPQSNVVVTSTDRQGTLGVQAGSLLDPDFYLTAGLALPDWYDQDAGAWADCVPAWQPNARLAYALIESGIHKCQLLMSQDNAAATAIGVAGAKATAAAEKRAAALAVADQPIDDQDVMIALLEYQVANGEARLAQRAAIEAVTKLMASPRWKNSWKPLPRTPLILLLDQLTTDDAAGVLDALEHFADDAGDPVLDWAKMHILGGHRIGGHDIPAPSIAGQPGFLLEYRSAQPGQFTDKFYYTASEAELYAAPATPQVRRAQAEAAAQRARRRSASF